VVSEALILRIFFLPAGSLVSLIRSVKFPSAQENLPRHVDYPHPLLGKIGATSGRSGSASGRPRASKRRGRDWFAPTQGGHQHQSPPRSPTRCSGAATRGHDKPPVHGRPADQIGRETARISAAASSFPSSILCDNPASLPPDAESHHGGINPPRNHRLRCWHTQQLVLSNLVLVLLLLILRFHLLLYLLHHLANPKLFHLVPHRIPQLTTHTIPQLAPLKIPHLLHLRYISRANHQILYLQYTTKSTQTLSQTHNTTTKFPLLTPTNKKTHANNFSSSTTLSHHPHSSFAHNIPTILTICHIQAWFRLKPPISPHTHHR
jgi:hypothetical protein